MTDLVVKLTEWFDRLDFDRENEATRRSEYSEMLEILAHNPKITHSGEALVFQLEAVIDRLDGQAYSSTLSALNQFKADLARPGLAAIPTTGDPLVGLDERLDRLCLTEKDTNNRFILSTESAKNIVGIVREWLRVKGGPAATAGWQPIETAPRDGSRILATGGGLDDTIEVVSYNNQVGAWNTENYTLDDRADDAEGYNRPSHWQSLPASLVSRPEPAASPPSVTDEMVTEAMRAFERMSSVLRYREKDKWHSCDIMGMRDAIAAALAVSRPEPAAAPASIEQLRTLAFELTPADQYRLAFFIAENVGYILISELDHPDSPHDGTVHSYAAEYEFRGDGGDHVPTENERAMIEDAIEGYIAIAVSRQPFLWCCHVRGPDDVYAAPDYMTALAWSDALNEINWRGASDLKIENPKSFEDCLIKAVPAPWPHTAEAHATNLPRSIADFSDPSASRPEPAATPARDATEAMALAGARSIGNTIHTDNHMVRARECWRAMWDARDGIVEPIPQGAPHSRPTGCICQEQHRRGYCTEPGCPYSVTRPEPAATPAQTEMVHFTEDQIRHMVDRFLGWRVPSNFNPDAGITYTPARQLPGIDRRPSGTNLLDATQAEAMLRYIVDGMLSPHSRPESAATPPTDEQTADDLGHIEVWYRGFKAGAKWQRANLAATPPVSRPHRAPIAGPIEFDQGMLKRDATLDESVPTASSPADSIPSRRPPE